MSAALHLISNKVPGHGPSDSGNLPCSGLYGRAMGVTAHPPGVNKTLLLAKGVPLKCSSGRMSFVCRASSNSQRRNPRQNRQGFSQNKNRQNEERDYSDHLEDPDYMSSKNGPLLSFANSNKNQATAGPGPREREIVELFRRVQARLRERAAGKEEKKFEVSKGQNKGNETVDSLLKLLRKHSVEQGKKKVNGGGASGIEVNFDQPEQVGRFDEDNSRSSFNPISSIRDQPQEENTSSFTRPPSNFRRRSPVPRMRYEPIISDKETASFVSPFDPVEKSNKTDFSSDEEPQIQLEPEIEAELEHDTELESSFADRDVAGEILEVDDETSASRVAHDNEADEEDDNDDDDEGEEKPTTEHKNLNAMKLQELRALAKARSIKRYSKLKKSELIGLLSEDAF